MESEGGEIAMTPSTRVLVVDADPSTMKLVREALAHGNYDISGVAHGSAALRRVAELRPNVILIDIVLPGVDGLTVCKEIRSRAEFEGIRVIVASAKGFEADRELARQVGADAFLRKPLDRGRLRGQLEEVLVSKVSMTFWGVRGSLPMPGPTTVKYGGNTPCVELRFPKGQRVIFDAGSGIRGLGSDIMRRGEKLDARLLLTHFHWDHIQGLPFFTPASVGGNELEILGPRHPNASLQQIIAGQMDNVYFPIPFKAFGATVSFRELGEGEHGLDGLKVKALFLNHPGQALGYRLAVGERSLAYVTDNEMDPDGPREFKERLVRFVDGVDYLIHDSSYLDEQYVAKRGWGHPPLSEVIDLAIRASTKTLFLFHHDHEAGDGLVDHKLAVAREMIARAGAAIRCEAATEGMRYDL